MSQIIKSSSGGGGGGNVSGPGSSTDRAVATWDGTTGTALFDNPTAIINSSGIYTNSALPSAYIYTSSNQIFATGNGFVYTFGSGNPITQVFNVGSFYVGSGSFIAPVAGKYFFCGGAVVTACTTASRIALLFTTMPGGGGGGTGFPNQAVVLNTRPGSSADISVSGSCIVSLGVNNAVQVSVVVTGESDDNDTVRGGAVTFGGQNYPYSWCAGYLIG